MISEARRRQTRERLRREMTGCKYRRQLLMPAAERVVGLSLICRRIRSTFSPDTISEGESAFIPFDFFWVLLDHRSSLSPFHSFVNTHSRRWQWFAPAYQPTYLPGTIMHALTIKLLLHLTFDQSESELKMLISKLASQHNMMAAFPCHDLPG